MEEIQLSALPHAEARRLVAGGAPVYLSVNPVEYHGPHLSLLNDFVLSEGTTRALHAELRKKNPEWPLLLAAPLHVGVEPAPGPGSAPVSFVTVRKLIQKAAQSLIDLGASRVILQTFHGNPLHNLAVHAGVKYLRARGVRALSPFNTVLNSLLEYEPGHFDEALAFVKDPELRAAMRIDLAHDFHAGFFETSLVLHFRPEAVAPSHRDLPHCGERPPHAVCAALSRIFKSWGFKKLASEFDFLAYGLGWMHMTGYCGYTGWPSVASAEAGAVFAREIIRRYVAVTEAVLFQDAPVPEPILMWTGPLSLNGRIVPPTPS